MAHVNHNVLNSRCYNKKKLKRRKNIIKKNKRKKRRDEHENEIEFNDIKKGRNIEREPKAKEENGEKDSQKN